MTGNEVAESKIEYQRYSDFPSQYVVPRNVDVWSPPGYDEQTGTRYPVIYMHDGQNLFDPALSTFGVTWGVAETLTELINEKFGGAIVVGVWNSGEGRARDYMPQKPLETAEAAALKSDFIAQKNGESVSDRYLRFLVEELKPFIDKTYRTLPDQTNTFIMGSSMGGLISLYALEEYPEVFSRAGCLSTHWTIGGELLVDLMGSALPKPDNHKLYFDYGTVGLDSDYEPYQQRMDRILEVSGYTRGEDFLSLKFEGEEHSERAWSKRLAIPLRFLLGLQ
ncbi:MAG TPA: alpha/beta hydrolase-fold protein [Chloroflexia bacterium]|nr:alpha/beta hydrolase-fold protein [Chloroflexia bacterium]